LQLLFDRRVNDVHGRCENPITENLDIDKIRRKAYPREASSNIFMKRTPDMDDKPDKSTLRPYHHGDLHAALLAAAEEILESEGLQALTLRAAARAAGVSHAAPSHHFGDLTGLLSDLAAVGYVRFAAELSDAMENAGQDPNLRLRAMGSAYVQFARAHPGMFMLMFRSERLDVARPALKDAMTAAHGALRDAISARAGASLPPAQIIAQQASAWTLVHGFAMLLLDGRLETLIAALPAGGDAASLLEMVFAVTTFGGPDTCETRSE
jgi:AcrR family transcriptional regulator